MTTNNDTGEKKPNPTSIATMQFIVNYLFAFGELEKPETTKPFSLNTYKGQWDKFINKVATKKG